MFLYSILILRVIEKRTYLTANFSVKYQNPVTKSKVDNL